MGVAIAGYFDYVFNYFQFLELNNFQDRFDGLYQKQIRLLKVSDNTAHHKHTHC